MEQQKRLNKKVKPIKILINIPNTMIVSSGKMEAPAAKKWPEAVMRGREKE